MFDKADLWAFIQRRLSASSLLASFPLFLNDNEIDIDVSPAPNPIVGLDTLISINPRLIT